MRQQAIAAVLSSIFAFSVNTSNAETLKCTPELQTRFNGRSMELIGIADPDVFTFETQTGEYSLVGFENLTRKKFQVVSRNAPLFINAVDQTCIKNLCIGRFLAIALPGQATVNGNALPRLTPELTFMFVEGNGPATLTGRCTRLAK